MRAARRSTTCRSTRRTRPADDNLCHLVSRGAPGPAAGARRACRASTTSKAVREGLIALTGAHEGALARLLADGKADEAEAIARRLDALFPGRLYVELARRGDAVAEAAEDALIDLAYARDLPLVATNPANFADPHFHAAHDAMLCIAHSTHIDAAERPRSSPEAWVKSAPMMEELFADLPEATANTLVVAQRCAFAPPKRKPILPSLAGDLEGEARMLAEDSRARPGRAARTLRRALGRGAQGLSSTGSSSRSTSSTRWAFPATS